MTPSHFFSNVHTAGVRAKVLLLLGALLLVAPAGTAGQYAAEQSPPAVADEPPSYADDEVPAHVAVVDGTAVLERDGRSEEAVENVPLLAGDRLRTQRGRVDILFADGSAVDLDEYTEVDLLSDSLMRLLAGRVRVSMARTSLTAAGDTLEYRVDTVAGSALIRTAGDYRIALLTSGPEPAMDLAVWRGTAELDNGLGRTLVRAGMHAYATARSAPSRPFGFNSAMWDPFDRWTEDLRGARYGASSASYLPADLRYYSGAFDRYGSWAYEPAYGQVWYPRVDVGWRPYSAGRWSFVGRFGWFWVGIDRWSWPTHHYGRWGLSAANRWFWRPERRWAPAWVSWGYAPGYVTWCPLGISGYPVVSVASLYYSRGWSILPSRLFTHNVVVSRHVVDARFFSPSLRSTIAVRNTAPAWQQTGRPSVPLRGPGGAGRFSGARVERPRPEGPRPAGVPSGRAVPRNAPRTEAPALRPVEPNRSVGSNPANLYRRAQPGTRVERPRQIQREPQPSVPSRPAVDPRGLPSADESRSYSRMRPLEAPSMPSREPGRVVPRSPQRSEAPRYAPPSHRAPAPPVAAPSRPRPSESSGSGRAVERRRGNNR